MVHKEEQDRSWLELGHITRFVCAKSAGNPSKEDAATSFSAVGARRRRNAAGARGSVLAKIDGTRVRKGNLKTGK
jgi:hypothetical protein